MRAHCTFVGLFVNYNWIMLAGFIPRIFLLTTSSDLIIYLITLSKTLSILMPVKNILQLTESIFFQKLRDMRNLVFLLGKPFGQVSSGGRFFFLTLHV